ncbi:MAG TPA: glycoside hydrolase family 2 TIM barrel-domain containing protein, partial [Rubrivivax sp.]|nr:glycoside hydrolase family 2 TIM barrel-domain containing protein [Rubrivivax sp.]
MTDDVMDHPRPQFRRAKWLSLDGTWAFCFDDAYRWTGPRDLQLDQAIRVPYAPESLRSGIADVGFHVRCWYQRRVDLSGLGLQPGDRLRLHFGAVDYRATVWADGQRVGCHVGGHSPFCIDITENLEPGATEVTITVLAEDDPQDMHQPRGKQGWLADPHSIWYPRTSGIWRTVWAERVPASHLARLRWTPDFSRWRIGFSAHIKGLRAGMTLSLTLRADSNLLAHEVLTLTSADIARDIHLPDPGIDDARADLQWSPEHPQLIDATVELRDADGRVVDAIEGYTAMRSVRIEDGRFLLNDRPYPLRMVLDQGYWPQSLMTADDVELRTDIEAIKRLGFNGARKHQKSEDPRWLYWADRLGLCVWSEMPSPYGFSDASVHALCDEWRSLVERDLSHPCIVAWVPVNESWGVPGLPTEPRQVDLVKTLYHMTRALDGTRPVVGNDGWEMPCGDIVSIHDYTDKPAKLLARYGTREAVLQTLRHERPGGGRKLLIDGWEPREQPVMLTEFGGIAPLREEDEGWGYSRVEPGASFAERYVALMAAVHACEGLRGFCYTQLTDTFLEKNGLLTPERQPKADPLLIARATRGPEIDREVDLKNNPLGYNRRWMKRLRRLGRAVIAEAAAVVSQAALGDPSAPETGGMRDALIDAP